MTYVKFAYEFLFIFIVMVISGIVSEIKQYVGQKLRIIFSFPFLQPLGENG